jgi:hypothetical protein
MEPEVQFCVYNSPSLDSTFSQINSVNNLTSYFFKINFNIIIPYISQVVSSIQVFGLKMCKHFSTPPCVINLRLIVSSLPVSTCSFLTSGPTVATMWPTALTAKSLSDLRKTNAVTRP